MTYTHTYICIYMLLYFHIHLCSNSDQCHWQEPTGRIAWKQTLYCGSLSTNHYSKKRQNMCRDFCIKLFKLLSFPETLLSLTPVPCAQGACLEMVALSCSVKPRFCCLRSPGKAARAQGQRKTAQSWGLVYSCVGKKTGRRKWGLTVSWSTIGWWQIQCDWAELGDDPYSMQNSLSSWSVPTSP